MRLVQQFIQDEEAQDVVEYGLLIAVIAVVTLIGTKAFGTSINTWFTALSGKITTTG